MTPIPGEPLEPKPPELTTSDGRKVKLKITGGLATPVKPVEQRSAAASNRRARIPGRPSTRITPAVEPHRGRIVSIPLCPTVLAMAAVEPRDVGGVARELSRRGLGHGLPAHQAATVTVSRVRGARLISKGGARVLRIP